MMKIDFHCHTTKRKVEDLLVESATVETIAEKMKENNIERTVLLATYFPQRGSGVSNFRLLRWIENKPEFVMFGSLDFEHYFHQGMNELTELAEGKLMKGIKVYTGYQQIDLHSAEMNEVVKLASKNNLVMMFHCGYSYSSMRKTGKPTYTGMVRAGDIEFLAKENQNVNFVASHLAKPYSGDLIRVLKENSNVYTDLSGLTDSKNDRKEIPFCVRNVESVLEQAGSEKVLFGTDFPVQTHEDSVYFVEEAMKRFSEKEKQNVYYDNARRLLGWKT
jgi:predicted TIM-barrel fold metal-dependent hydrolase